MVDATTILKNAGYNASEDEKIVRAMMSELKHLRSPHYRHHITDDKISKVVKVGQFP